MLLFYKNKAWTNRIIFLEWENKPTQNISADNHTKEDGSKDELLILQYNLNYQEHKNINICVRRQITHFLGIVILSTHINCVLLMQAQEIISGFGSEFTLMSGLGTMEMWIYGIWAY